MSGKQIKCAELALRGLQIELQPSQSWREGAKAGRKLMSYRIYAAATAPEAGDVRVSFSVPAVRDGELRDLGTPEIPVVARLLAKNSDQIDCAKLAEGWDGQPLTDGNGALVYDEPAIVTESGEEFDLAFGTLYFCAIHGGIRLTLKDATLTDTGRTDQKGVPVYRTEYADFEVSRRAEAKGGVLNVPVGVTKSGPALQAARNAASSKPQPPAELPC